MIKHPPKRAYWWWNIRVQNKNKLRDRYNYGCSLLHFTSLHSLPTHARSVLKALCTRYKTTGTYIHTYMHTCIQSAECHFELVDLPVWGDRSDEPNGRGPKVRQFHMWVPLDSTSALVYTICTREVRSMGVFFLFLICGLLLTPNKMNFWYIHSPLANSNTGTGMLLASYRYQGKYWLTVLVLLEYYWCHNPRRV